MDRSLKRASPNLSPRYRLDCDITLSFVSLPIYSLFLGAVAVAIDASQSGNKWHP